MGAPDEFVSDDARERVVGSLRDDLLAGRLSLEEFSERIELAYAARRGHELALARKDLPESAAGVAPGVGLRPTRLTASLFGRVIKRGRLSLRRWSLAVAGFADLDLDLRQAELSAEQTTVTLLVGFGNADVYIPEGVRTIVGGLSVFSRRRDWGDDAARSDAPRIRVRVFSLFGTVDIWRVPRDARGGYSEIIRALREAQRQLPG